MDGSPPGQPYPRHSTLSGRQLRTFTSSAAMYTYTVRLTRLLAMLSVSQIELAHIERAHIGNAGRSLAACRDSRRRVGITRKRCGSQPTLQGDLAVGYLEGDHLGAAFQVHRHLRRI